MTWVYLSPATIREAVELVAESPDETLIMGGGTFVMPWLTRGEVVPRRVVDLHAIPELRAVNVAPHTVEIGAGATYADLRRSLADEIPMLVNAAAGITGGPQIQNQGTLGGSAAYGSPSSDAPALLVALDARLVIGNRSGFRSVVATEFFRGQFSTALLSGDVLTAISVPRNNAGLPWGYVKLKRSESSWPIVSAAATVARVESGDAQMSGHDSAHQLRVVVGAAAPVPIVVSARVETEGLSEWMEAVGEQWRAATSATGWRQDELASADYRRRVAPVAIERVLQQAHIRLLERMRRPAGSRRRHCEGPARTDGRTEEA